MLQELEKIKAKACADLEKTDSLDEVYRIKTIYLGKKGAMTQVLRGMGKLPPEERPIVGNIANRIKQELEKLFKEKEEAIKKKEREEAYKAKKIDITLPGVSFEQGQLHPITLVLEEIKEIFFSMGFTIADGPEVETDYYNFEALNLPKDHPARDMQDSFYLARELLLRTHTSPVQVRVMEKMAPELPVRIIAPGKVYRRDDDATHSPMFHQVEGLLVDKNVSLSNLKGTLLVFARQMFGPKQKIRLRPSYFPFTEPSAEVDISCVMCHGKGCRVCKDTGWLEILGSGMVHPRVFEMSGYDPDVVTGFAFGMGVERIAMLKYGIDDMRLFYDNDIRLLKQFC
ncbi:MAG TPA: phenylalanine--tRNA ligase subunit alpha [Firmicutes bacterium]|nr:phenylalanine--tRNA ligase subunit alpha [Bacillota bacterium]